MNKIICLFVCLFAPVVNAALITIDFDDMASGTAVGNNYAGQGVTFIDAVTNSHGSLSGGSAPIGISHAVSSFQPQTDNPIEAVFGSAVSSVSLTGLDVGGNGFILSAYDATSGGSLLASEQVFGTGAGVGEFFTLSLSALGIQRVEFSQVLSAPGDGIVFDNFSFDTAAVPEPASLILFTLGLLGLGMSRRKK